MQSAKSREKEKNLIRQQFCGTLLEVQVIYGV